MALTATQKAWTGVALVVLLAIGASLAIAFGFGGVRPHAVKADRYSDVYPILLIFDLQDDAHPSAALAVNGPPQPRRESINVPLFLPATALDANERGLVRVGSYDRWTIVTFSGLGRAWPQQISLVPALVRSGDPTVVEARPDAGAFLVTQGQIRRFTYRYPQARDIADATRRSGGVAMTIPSAIAVTLPPLATEFPVAAGRLTIPDRINRREMVFPGAPVDPAEPYLRVAYSLPPSDIQSFVVEWGLKIAAAFLPIALLLFVDRAKLTSPGLVRWLAIGAGLIMLLLFSAAIWVGVLTGNLVKVMPDILLILISAVGSVVTLAFKRD